MKQCAKCLETKPLDAFNVATQSKDGRRPRCKECRVADRALLRPAIADDFEVKGTSSELSPDGEIKTQWVQARPERTIIEGVKEAIPTAHYVKGMSTLVDESGKVVAQWIKTSVEQEARYDALIKAIKTIVEPWDGFDPVAAPSYSDDDLMCIYPMGDPHIGMFTWGEETGTDFDMKIAERNLCGAVDQLVASAPNAKRALLLNLGDYFHGDNPQNRTTRSGHALDIDTRWAKVLRVGLRAFRRNIDRALEKHEIVEVWSMIGNHDDCSSIMLSLALEQAYEREPRVLINTSPAKHQAMQFGQNMISSTHTDTCRMRDLIRIMACDWPEMWGATRYRYGYTGHVHHDSAIEEPGAKVESFRTLAPKDAYHSASKYRSGQDMKCITLHREYGEISRNTVGISRL